MTLLERIQAIEDLHTMYVLGELNQYEVWECIVAVVTGEDSGITWH